MARVKTARTTRARHKKILKQAKGYFGAKHYRFRNANQAVMKSLSYAYVGKNVSEIIPRDVAIVTAARKETKSLLLNIPILFFTIQPPI